MRIVSGKHGSRKLESLPGDNTRPTTDRVKEALFSSLSHKATFGVMVDLFSGSGSVGLEGLSRGFDKCYFIDNNARAVKIIKNNVANLKEQSQSVVIKNEYSLAIAKINEPIDFIFIDPPYNRIDIDEIMTHVNRLDFNNDAIICIETERELTLKDQYFDFVLYNEKNYGTSKLSYYQLEV